MIYNIETATKVAEFLLQIKAVKFSPEKPFTWASGWKSPIYCDNRIILSYPSIRTFIRQQFVEAINDKFSKPDVIVGVATGAIAHGMLVAQDLGLPFAYVRPEPKKHGMGNQIEGIVNSGQTVLVIEDLISTAKSSINAIEALKDAGASVKGLLAIFSYNFPQAEEAFDKHKINTLTLSNYDILLSIALKHGYVSEKTIQSLKAWRTSPATWQQ